MPVPMVGREAALGELRQAWRRARRTGRTVPAVVTGARGTGKSRLAAAAVQATGAPTVLAGAARLHSPAPYDWLAAVLAGRDRAGRDPLGAGVPPDALAWLAQDPDVPRQRYAPEALLRIAVRAVRALAAPGPAVLLVEDLHALDPASLMLVAELAGGTLPAVLLVTSRPPQEAVSPELTAAVLARLAGAPGAVRRHLGPLDAAQVARVLAHAYPHGPPPGLAAAAHRRTGGNPYRLVELLAVEGPDAPPAPGPALTARERQVLGRLAEGMSNKQIARALGISVRTVTVHVSNLLRKTGATSRTEAALWAVRRDVTTGAPATADAAVRTG